jgi:hypothetical protein
MIYECASQINGNAPKVIAGRGTGAILATKMVKKENITILIDPVWSIADAISDKYRFLYPKFLVRADVKIEKKDISTSNNIVILSDRARFNDRTQAISQTIVGVNLSKRDTKSLSEAILDVITRK